MLEARLLIETHCAARVAGGDRRVVAALAGVDRRAGAGAARRRHAVRHRRPRISPPDRRRQRKRSPDPPVRRPARPPAADRRHRGRPAIRPGSPASSPSTPRSPTPSSNAIRRPPPSGSRPICVGPTSWRARSRRRHGIGGDRRRRVRGVGPRARIGYKWGLSARQPAQGESQMPTYIMLTTLNPEGVQTIKNNPARIREVNKEVEQLGATVKAQWATLGRVRFHQRHRGAGRADDRSGLAGAQLPGHRPLRDADRDPHRRLHRRRSDG